MQDSCKGRFQVQGNTRFKAHSSAGVMHGREKGMLEVQENNQANFDVQCSRGARQILMCSAVEVQGSATTRLEVHGSVRRRIMTNTDKTMGGVYSSVTAWQCSEVSLHAKAVTRLSKRSMAV